MFARYEFEFVSEIVTVDCAAAGLAVLERFLPQARRKQQAGEYREQPAAFSDERH